jgi:hypothetical protein
MRVHFLRGLSNKSGGNMQDKKLCKKCNQLLDINMFYKDSRSKSGVTSYCKECNKALTKEWYVNNREKAIEYAIMNMARHPERSKEADKRYYYRHKEENNRQSKEWRKNNPEKADQYVRDWQKKHPDKIRGWHARYRKNNKEKEIIRHKKYKKEHPYMAIKHSHIRIAKMKSLRADFTKEQWNYVKQYFNNACCYCGRTDTKLTQDHLVALSAGGDYTIGNIVPACKSCNSSKCNVPLKNWYNRKDFFSKEMETKIYEYAAKFNNKKLAV